MEVEVGDALRGLRSKAPAELAEYFAQFEDLYDRKLWHQLTVKLKQFVLLPSARPFLISLQQQFIAHCEKKLNRQAFVQISIVTAKQYPDPKDALPFLNSASEKVKEDKPAYVLCQMEAAHFHLYLKDLESTKTAIETCEKLLESIEGVDPIVHASFYRVSADYHKAKAEYVPYYKNALLFLSCVDVKDLTAAERTERAYDLALAALLGDEIYNFGELLMHPILDGLKGSQHEWLYNLMFAFNAGDLGKYDVLSTNFSKQLCLMSLVELVFKRSADKRRIPFTVIGQETRLPHDEIEHLVMKALSLGLIKGSLDQVEQVVRVDWVQPRVLDKSQIGGLRQHLAEWSQKVQELATEMSNETPELFAH